MRSQISNNRKIIAIGVISAIGIAVVTFLIVLASGYSTNPDEGGYTTESARDLESLTNRLNRLESRVNSLAMETAVSQPPPTPEGQQTPTAMPTNTPYAKVSSPTPDPIATATPLPSITTTGPGICRRSPKLQIVLIDQLDITSCQLITAHELFRVIELPDLQFDGSPQPGDFAGLVNVKDLSIQIRHGSDLTSDTFHGLEGLETLTVVLQGKDDDDGAEKYDGKIEPGAFRGLSSIRALELSLNKRTDEPISMPPFEHMETLESLHIRIPRHLFAPAEQHFQNLPQLRNLSMTMVSGQAGIPKSLRLTQEIFKNNGKLESIQIRVDSNRKAVYADKDTFVRLEALESLSVSTFGEIELSLSPNSPLFKDILNGNQYAPGYTVLPPGAD